MTPKEKNDGWIIEMSTEDFMKHIAGWGMQSFPLKPELFKAEMEKATRQLKIREATTHEKALKEAVEAEREACAKLCDDYGDSMLPIIKTSAKKNTPYHLRSQGTAKGCAIAASRLSTAIRQRGTNP